MTKLSPSERPNHKRKPIYVGWWIVFALAVAEFALFGVAYYAFVIFTGGLGREFGWSGAETGSLVSAMWIAAPLALFCGPLVDRLGPWRLVLGGLMLEVIAFLLMSQISSFLELYLLRIMMGAGKVLVVSSFPVIVAQWFSKRFSTATALVWAGSPTGGLVLSPIAEIIATAYGWRTAAALFGVGVFAAILLVALLARIGASRQGGRGLDGAIENVALPQVEATGLQVAAAKAPALSWRDIRRSTSLMTAGSMILATIGIGIGNIAFSSQLPKLLGNAGVDPISAAAMLGSTAGAAAVGAASIGFVLDRAHVHWSSFIIGMAVLLGFASFYLLETTNIVAFSALGCALVGYATGAFELLWITLTQRQFGVRAFARTYGAWYFSLQVGCALGGGVGGWALEHLGSAGYLQILVLLYLPGVLLGFWRPGGCKLEAVAR